jgi:hypothetical protein
MIFGKASLHLSKVIDLKVPRHLQEKYYLENEEGQPPKKLRSRLGTMEICPPALVEEIMSN